MQQLQCACKGIRTCALCEDPEYRYNIKHLKQHPKTLEDIQEEPDVATFQLKGDQLNLLGATSEELLASFLANQSIDLETLQFSGLYLHSGFLSQETQSEFERELDRFEWQPSQSGRRKQDYGPQANFKRKKLKMGNFKGLPSFIFPYIEQLRQSESLSKVLKDFRVAELNALEYREEVNSSIAAHFDDFWLWGERIIGINLLSDTVMTFSRRVQVGERKLQLEIEVPIKAGDVYLMAGKARLLWQHGIKAKHIKGRRLVCTIRELPPDLEATEIGREILEVASQSL